MPRPKPKRTYDATSRRQAALATRRAVLHAARSLFVERGYAATAMTAIAERADIALDTVYAVVGKKPALFRLLVELAISGEDHPVPAIERDYVRAIRSEPRADEKLRIYASALRAIQPRLAPLFQVLQTAAPVDADLKALWEEISTRRADNMLLLAEELAETGRLRPDLTVRRAADVLWTMNSPELYLLVTAQRGWNPEEFEAWLADAWVRLLLAP